MRSASLSILGWVDGFARLAEIPEARMCGRVRDDQRLPLFAHQPNQSLIESHAHPADAFLVSNVVNVATAVNRFIDEGASVIKCYYRLPADFIAAACTAAHKHGVPVTAHLELVDAREAILAGLDGVEHVTSFGTALAEPKEAEAFRSAVNQDNEARRKERYRLWSRLDFDRSSRVTPVIDLIVRKHVTLSPTLAVFERRPRDRGATEMEWRGFENMLKFIALCHRAGARIVAGSHTDVPHASRGWAYQRELELLKECGLSNAEVIRAATESLNGIDLWDVKRSYRFEQGFTFEVNLSGVSDEHRDAFVGKRETDTTK